MPDPLPALSFKDVDQIYATAKGLHPAFGGMSLQEFAQFANQKTRSQAFNAGLSGTVGTFVKRVSGGIDELVQPVAEVAGGLGESLGGLVSPRMAEIGRTVGEGTPRTAAEMLMALPLGAALVGSAPVTLPVAVLGGLGLASTAARGYTETGSVSAGGAQAAANLAMPGAARLGTGAATKLLLKQSVLPKAVERAGEYVGANVGAALAGELGGQASSVAAGQGLYNPLTMENLVAQTVGQIPFAAFDIPQLVRGYKPVRVGEKTVGAQPVGFGDLMQPAPIPSLTEWQRGMAAVQQMQSAVAPAKAALETDTSAQTKTVRPKTVAPVSPAAVKPPKTVKAPPVVTPAPPTTPDPFIGVPPTGPVGAPIERAILDVFKEDDTPVDMFKKLSTAVKQQLPGVTDEDKVRYLDARLAGGLGLVPVKPPVVAAKPISTGGSVGDFLYNTLWNAAQKGETTLGGAENPVLATAVPLVKSGQIKSRDELKAWMQTQGPVAGKGSKPAAKVDLLTDEVKRLKTLQNKKRTPEEEAEFKALETKAGQTMLPIPSPAREPAMRNMLTGEIYKGGRLHALVPIPGQVEAASLERGWVNQAGNFSPMDIPLKDMFTEEQLQYGFGLTSVEQMSAPRPFGITPTSTGELPVQSLMKRLEQILTKKEYEYLRKAGLGAMLGGPGGGRTHVPIKELASWLIENGPRAEVLSLKAGAEPPSDLHGSLAYLEHQLETLGFPVIYDQAGIPRGMHDPNGNPIDSDHVPPDVQALYYRIEGLGESGQAKGDFVSATTEYPMVNPKPLDKLTDAADIVVRAPGEEFHSGYHFGPYDENVIGWTRGSTEVLPTGERVWHIFESQTDAGGIDKRKTMGGTEYVTSDGKKFDSYDAAQKHLAEIHPLLADWQRLALKASIKHALDTGHQYIALSDAQTAMLTEGHDTAARSYYIEGEHEVKWNGERRKVRVDYTARDEEVFQMQEPSGKWTNLTDYPVEDHDALMVSVLEQLPEGTPKISQEEGMRKNYDVLAPAILEDLTGSKPIKVSFGDHQNVIGRGVLVLKNPDGSYQLDIKANMFSLAKVRRVMAERLGFSFFSKDQITAFLKEMEAEGASGERLLRAQQALEGVARKPGQSLEDWMAEQAGVDPRINQEGQPDALLATSRAYFDRYFTLRGFSPETTQHLTEMASRVAARFLPTLDRTRVMPVAEGGTHFYLPGRAGKMNDVIGLVGRTFKGQPQAVETAAQMVALGHEGYHGLESSYANGTLPVELQEPFRLALDGAEQLSYGERREVISWALKQLGVPDGVFDYHMGTYANSVGGASEFLADLTGILSLASTTKNGRLMASDWAMFGNKTTRGYIQSVVTMLQDTLRAIVEWGKKALGIGRVDKRTLEQYESISANLKTILGDTKRADEAALAYHAIVDRTNGDIVDYQPTLDRRLVGQYVDNLVDAKLVSDGPRDMEVEAAIKDLEDIPKEYKPFGDRMSWYHWGYPMSQLAASFPQLKGAVDLGFQHHGMAARYIQETWNTHFLDDKGKFDRARLKRIGREGSLTNKAFNAAALVQNAEQAVVTGQELATMLKKSFPGISDAEIRDVDVSLQQMGQINVRLARLRVQSHKDDVKGAVVGLLMSNDRSMKANAAWGVADSVVEMAFNGQLMGGIPQGVAAMLAQTGIHLDVAQSIGESVDANYKAHVTLAERLLGEDLRGKPWWQSEVRLGEWTVAWMDGQKVRHLEAFREQGPAEARFRQVEKMPGVVYLKSFNKSDRAESFKNVQSELIDAYKDADSIYYQSVISKIRDKAPDIAQEMEELYQPGMGATRMTTSPYMLNRELKAGREGLNMVAGQVHYVDSTAYGLAKRFVKTRQRGILQDPEMRANEQLRAVAKKYLSAVTDPEGKEFTGLKNLVFLHFMGFNPSHLVVEPAQLLSSHAPLLVRYGDGIGEAHARIARASYAVGAGSVQHLLRPDGELTISAKGIKGGVTDVDLQDLLSQGKLARVIETGFVSDMFSLEDTDFAAARSLITGTGKVEGVKDLVRNSAYWTAKLARSFYGIAPRFNSRVALVSSYEQARMKGAGHEEAVQTAITNTRESMLGGGVVNRPMALHVLGKAQGVGGLIYSLQSYTANMYSLFGRLIKDSLPKSGLKGGELRSARKALLNMGVTQLLFGGLLGLPTSVAAIKLWEALFRDADVKRDLRQAFMDMAGDDEEWGNLLAEGALGGVVNAALPVADVGSRFQLGTFFGVSPYDGLTWKNLFGPTGSLVEAYGKGARGLIEQDWPATIGMAPSGLRGALKLMQNQEMVTDAKGRALFAPTDAEKALMLTGFKPRRLSQHYEKSAMDQRAQEMADRDRDEFISRMADLVEAGKFAEVQAAMYDRQKELRGTFDVRAASSRVAEVVQKRHTPRLGAVEGTRDAATQLQQISRLYPSIRPQGPAILETYLQQQNLVRQMGMPGAGIPNPSAIRRAALVDRLMKDNPAMTRQMAEIMAERVMNPRGTSQRLGPTGPVQP